MLERLFPLDKAPAGWRRVLLRSPVLLYRIGLGRLFGHRFLVVTSRGRKTGRIYRTPLEVVRYDQVSGEAVVGSGWGANASWYRNIQATPALEIWLGGHRFRPAQRFLNAEEAVEVMLDYASRNPAAAQELGSWMLGRPYDNSREAAEALVEKVPFVAFRPAGDV
jgi:deazaflavin-dependent oxidoreductase (nitroreductase family)